MSPAQLHHVLKEYSCSKVCPSGWTPSPADAEDAVRTGESRESPVQPVQSPESSISSLPAGDILEGFDRHPPLILPSSSFQLELRNATVEPALFLQLRRLQAFVRRLPRREGGAPRGVEEQVRSSAASRRSVNIWF